MKERGGKEGEVGVVYSEKIEFDFWYLYAVLYTIHTVRKKKKGEGFFSSSFFGGSCTPLQSCIRLLLSICLFVHSPFHTHPPFPSSLPKIKPQEKRHKRGFGGVGIFVLF